jgi:hypothetical protein
MGRTLDLFGQPSPYRPHSPRGATLSVAKKDERVALIFWARTALSQRRDVITRSGEHSGEGDLLLISRGELRRSDALVKPWYPRFGSRFWKVRPGRFQKTRCKHRCRRRGSQGRVFATGNEGQHRFIRATPLSEGPQSAASRLIVRPERSNQIL